MCINCRGREVWGKANPLPGELRPAKESSAFLGAWSRDWYSCDQGLGSFPLILSPWAPRGTDGNIKISPCSMFSLWMEDLLRPCLFSLLSLVVFLSHNSISIEKYEYYKNIFKCKSKRIFKFSFAVFLQLKIILSARGDPNNGSKMWYPCSIWFVSAATLTYACHTLFFFFSTLFLYFCGA